MGQLDLKLSKKNYDTLFDSHKNIQRLCEEKRKNCCNSKGSFMWTTGSEDSYVTDDIVRHEAPISQVDIAGKGKVPKLVAASNSLSEDGATTTSAKEISSLLQSQKVKLNFFLGYPYFPFLFLILSVDSSYHLLSWKMRGKYTQLQRIACSL